MSVWAWDLFVKAAALAFLAYWVHLGSSLDDWLGSKGFHLKSPSTVVFAPLPPPWPHIFWCIIFSGSLLMLYRPTVFLGSFAVGVGFFYATMLDPASAGALNMHFLFGFAVIFWSTSLNKGSDLTMSAWPAYLIRLYLVVVYFGSGWRKVIYGDWLSNHNVLVHCITGYFTTDLTRWIYSITPPIGWTVMQYLTITFELGAPLLLLYPPLRKGGVSLGCLLHLGIALLMKDLFYFSLQMLTFYIPLLISVSHLNDGSSKNDHQSEI